MYGNKENEGLIPQSSKKIGVMKQLSKYMSRVKLKFFSIGIFYSKLSYYLPVFENGFGLNQYKEEVHQLLKEEQQQAAGPPYQAEPNSIKSKSRLIYRTASSGHKLIIYSANDSSSNCGQGT